MKSFYKIVITVILLLTFLGVNISASDILRGDVSGDNLTNGADAIYLLRHTIMPQIYPINQSGDMDGNGLSNSADAIYLLRHTIMPNLYPLAGTECKHIEKTLSSKAPTCTEAGLTEGKVCTVCHVTLVGQTVVSATGHHYISSVIAPTCTEKGYTNHTCVCGDAYQDTD